MSDTHAAGDSAPLSVDAAAELLSAPPEKKPTRAAAEPAPAEDEPEIEPEAEADEPQPGDEDYIEAEPDASDLDPEDEPEAEEPARPAIDPPASWDAEAKADFAQLPRPLQEKMVAREQQREVAVNSALERASNAEKSAATVTQLGQALQQIVPRAAAIFQGKWDGVDWSQLAKDDPLAFIQQKQEYDDEKAELQRLQTAQQIAENERLQQFLDAREQQLPQTAPDLCGPEANAKRVELSSYLVKSGIPAELIQQADAGMLGIAYKAMRFDQLQAQARAGGATTPTPRTPSAAAPSPRPVRPSTPPAAGNSRTREIQRVTNRLAQTGSVDDATDLLRLQRKGR